MLAELRPSLEALGYTVESSKRVQRQGPPSGPHRRAGRRAHRLRGRRRPRRAWCAGRDRAGRGAQNNVVYRDMVRASLIVGARFLVLGRDGRVPASLAAQRRATGTPVTCSMLSTPVAGWRSRSRAFALRLLSGLEHDCRLAHDSCPRTSAMTPRSASRSPTRSSHPAGSGTARSRPSSARTATGWSATSPNASYSPYRSKRGGSRCRAPIALAMRRSAFLDQLLNNLGVCNQCGGEAFARSSKPRPIRCDPDHDGLLLAPVGPFIVSAVRGGRLRGVHDGLALAARDAERRPAAIRQGARNRSCSLGPRHLHVLRHGFLFSRRSLCRLLIGGPVQEINEDPRHRCSKHDVGVEPLRRADPRADVA